MLPCVSARLDFPSRGCVSYLPYFASFFSSFFFLLNTYFMCNEAHLQNCASRIYGIYIYIYIYKLFPSVHQIALHYGPCKNMFFRMHFQLNFHPHPPKKKKKKCLFFFPPFLAELPARIVRQNKMPHSKCNLQFVLFF